MRCTSSRFFTAPPRRLAASSSSFASFSLHRLAVAALARVADEPADAERQAAVGVHFDRHLVVRAADAPRLHLERGLHVLDRLLEHLQRIVAGLLLDGREAAVHDLLGRAALAVAHQRADELRHQRAAVERVEGNFTLRDFSTSWHFLIACQLPTASHQRADSVGVGSWDLGSSYDLGRFAPYFERPCLRPCTPTASSVPRTTW